MPSTVEAEYIVCVVLLWLCAPRSGTPVRRCESQLAHPSHHPHTHGAIAAWYSEQAPRCTTVFTARKSIRSVFAFPTTTFHIKTTLL